MSLPAAGWPALLRTRRSDVPKARPTADAALAYGAALSCGVALLLTLMPLLAITGEGGVWRSPAGDMAQGLTGHLAFQLDAWRWPPLFAENLFWPHGVSVALTDSNPLFSLVAKLLDSVAPGRPRNLLGVWFACCWLLQPVAAVYALRALTRSVAGAVTAAVLAGLFPALLVRLGHVNLCGHFLLLLALGITLRLIFRQTAWRWIAAGLVLAIAVLCHPYLFMAGAATLAAVPIQAMIRRQRGWWRPGIAFLLASGLPVLLFAALAGTLGGGDKGFVFYSMNLLSPFWPQRSGLFGANLPIIDATGGQYEGFCYLGAGSLLLLFAALPRIGRLRRWPGLVVVLAGLTLIALSSRVYAGSFKLIDLGAKPWEDLFAVFRASGRAFWPVGYALVVGAVAATCRLPAPVRLPLLGAAIVLQLIDTTPLRLAAERTMRGADGFAGSLPALPVDATLLTVLPTPGCSAAPEAKGASNPVLLAGIRAGMRLGDVGVGRTPAWFSCEAVLSDGMELPLLSREIRVYTDPAAQAALRPALLGPDAICRHEAGTVLCGRDVAMPAGDQFSPGEPVDRPDLPAPGLAGPALGKLLGSGWRAGADNVFWSEGPRATLLFGVEPGRPLAVTLHVLGVAPAKDGVRRVTIRSGRESIAVVDLPDLTPHEIAVILPPRTFDTGIVRLAFDAFRPVDPRRRGLAAPVQRASVQLRSIDVRQPAGSERRP